MIRLMISLLVLVLGGVVGLCFERYLHIKEPTIYFLLGALTVGLHIVLLYKTTAR